MTPHLLRTLGFFSTSTGIAAGAYLALYAEQQWYVALGVFFIVFNAAHLVYLLVLTARR